MLPAVSKSLSPLLVASSPSTPLSAESAEDSPPQTPTVDCVIVHICVHVKCVYVYVKYNYTCSVMCIQNQEMRGRRWQTLIHVYSHILVQIYHANTLRTPHYSPTHSPLVNGDKM